MGLWGAIKATLNSKLGTTDFLPLDKQIDALMAVDGYIPNEGVQEILVSDETTGTASSPAAAGNFTAEKDGVIRLAAVMKTSTNRPDQAGGLYVSFGMTNIMLIHASANTYTEYIVEMPVVAGRVYTFFVAAATGMAQTSISRLEIGYKTALIPINKPIGWGISEDLITAIFTSASRSYEVPYSFTSTIGGFWGINTQMSSGAKLSVYLDGNLVLSITESEAASVGLFVPAGSALTFETGEDGTYTSGALTGRKTYPSVVEGFVVNNI